MKKTINSKLIFSIVSIFVITVLVFSMISIFSIYNSTINTLNKTMTNMISIASQSISDRIEIFDTLLIEIASQDELINEDTTRKEQIEFIKVQNEKYKEKFGGDIFYAGKDGIVRGLEIDINDREFFKKGISGEHFLSDPIVRKDTGELGYTYVVPIEKNNNILGVLYIIIDYDIMSSTISKSSVGSNGSAYVINSNGTMVISKDKQKIIDSYNTSNEAQKDSSLISLAEIEKNAMKGNVGFGKYPYNFAAYSPIEKANQWSLIVTMKKSDFTSDIVKSIISTIITSVIMTILSILILSFITRKITKPIKDMTNRMELLANGDLDTPVKQIKSKDEIGLLNECISKTIVSLRNYIQNIIEITSKMAGNDFCIHIDIEYVGNFTSIKESFENIIFSLNKSLNDISQSTSIVENSSDQVSASSQLLSQGAIEQSNAIEKLAYNISQISLKINESATASYSAKDKTINVKDEINKSNEQMQKMIIAMNEIDITSSKISKIIKTIEDISFQTNILALNAAVEAARAGEAGKGFAVVAEEVRNLASKSSEAAKDTTSLIQNSISAVKNGMLIADNTAKSLLCVVDGVIEVAEIINKISGSNEQQSLSINEIKNIIEKISDVVQTNSATAEETAASSEELLSQAEQLKTLISSFNLNTL